MPFRWKGTGEANSTSYDCVSTGYKTVFFAWPFEGLADLEDRVEIMRDVIDWFGGCQGASSPCVLLVDDDQSPTLCYLPLILK